MTIFLKNHRMRHDTLGAEGTNSAIPRTLGAVASPSSKLFTWASAVCWLSAKAFAVASSCRKLSAVVSAFA